MNFFSKIKYYIVRLIEKIPFIQIFIYNFISYFHFLFPHEKDYYGLKQLVDIKNKKDFIDVGGNIGLSSIGFRQLGFNNKIIIFEPDQDYCYNKLFKLKKKLKKINIYNYGLSDKNENKIFYQCYLFGIKMHFLSTFDRKYLLNIIDQVYSFFKPFFKIKKEKLSLKKFDNLKLNINPIFIKIDVEGFDHKVIKGMLRSIKKFKPIILVELNRENFSEINHMLKNNYNPYQYIFEKKNFKKISNQQIRHFKKNFRRDFSFSLPRNVYFIPKK